MITRSSGQSLYYQIASDLRQKVTKMSVGTRLDTEAVLADYYCVSRGTIRQAVNELVAEGLLSKIQGNGTFRIEKDVSKHPYFINKSFTQQFSGSGHITDAVNISLRKIKANSIVANYLQIPTGTEVFHLSRLRTVDGIPYALAAAHIRKDILPNLNKKDFGQSLISLLQDTYHIELKSQQCYCRAILANKKTASALHIPENVPILQIENVISDDSNIPFVVDICQFTTSYYLHLESPSAES